MDWMTVVSIVVGVLVGLAVFWVLLVFVGLVLMARSAAKAERAFDRRFRERGRLR